MFQKTLILLFIMFLNSSCFKKAKVCPKTAGLEKINGIRVSVLEKPKDRTKVILGEEVFYLFVNENSELVLETDGKKQTLLDLKLKLPSGEEKLAYYVQVEWAGDSNQDCKPDFTVWKKLGIYVGKFEVASKTHEDAHDEKFYIESIKDKEFSYSVQSLGKY